VPGLHVIGFGPDENGEVLINAVHNYYYLRNGAFILAKPTGFTDTPKHIHQGQTGALWEVNLNETKHIKDGQTRLYQLRLKYLNYHIYSVYEDANGGLWVADWGKL
jgi:hypothetical protein